MKEPFRLYRLCERRGPARRCATWPACACDWYDRPTRPDGRRPWVHLPETATRKELAYRLALKYRQDAVEIAAGLKAPPPAPSPELGPLVKGYIQASVHTTKAKLTKVLEHFRDFVGPDMPVDHITSTRINEWRLACLPRRSKKTGGTLSKNTVQREYNAVKGFFSHLSDPDREDRELTRNPCDALDDWSETPAKRRLWTPDQHWLINELADRFRLPLTIGEHCICRRTEVLTLEKTQLSPRGTVVATVNKVKMGAIAFARQKKQDAAVEDWQLAPLWLVTELWKQIRSPFQRHVFGDPPPEPNAWSSNLTRALRTLGETYNVDTRGLSMHATRHATATVVNATAGAGSETARQMGGWQDLRQVQTYSSPGDAGKATGAAALATAWKPVKPKGLKKAAAVRKRA